MVVLELVLEHAPTPVPMLAPVVLEVVKVAVLVVLELVAELVLVAVDVLDALGIVKMTV